MRHNEVLLTLQRLTDKRPKQRELADALGVGISLISNRAVRNTLYSLEELIKISSYFNVDIINYSSFGDIVPAEINIETKTKEKNTNYNGKVYAIPYWEGCCECSDKLKRDDFPDLKLGIELIKSWNIKPENLRIIAMPGEEMNGGEMPIANKDLLVIDINRNNPYESGIFFATSHNCQRVYVRRLMETLNEKGESVIFSTVDNIIYKKSIERCWTKEMRTEADIKIIGRVITNATYTI